MFLSEEIVASDFKYLNKWEKLIFPDEDSLQSERKTLFFSICAG